MMAKPMYALQDVPGRGKGLVAVEPIPKGTQILSEQPIITTFNTASNIQELQESIRRQVDGLSDIQKHNFLSLHNIHPYKHDMERYLGIVRTNALPILVGQVEAGIFLEACRLNHACDNNAQKNWNENIRQHTVHALRDIAKGEEITIYYLRLQENRTARQEALLAKFGFTCSCRLCSLPPNQSQERDKLLDAIYRLDGLIGRGGIGGIISSPLRILRFVDRQIQLYESQGPGDSGLGRAFLDAAQIAIAHGDLARGRVFAERAASAWCTCLGIDSTEAIEYGRLAKDPSTHDLYGLSTKWESEVSQVPCGLDSIDFENWLWKRGKTPCPGQLADLRHPVTFPGFDNLPVENLIDLNFHQSSDMVAYQPRRHWCFLGEIVDFVTLLRLQMEIKDVDGTHVQLFFYTGSRGSEIAPKLVRKGYTIAVLYAQNHAFKFDDPGIRHENPGLIKIFPLSLRNLLALNDLVQQYSMEIDGLRRCHGCDKKAASPKRCAKCSLFSYCDRACQEVGWNIKGHKDHCKSLRDPDLRGLFVLEWHTFEKYLQFPLPVEATLEKLRPAPPEGSNKRIPTDKVGDEKSEPISVVGASPDIGSVKSTDRPFVIKEIPGKGKGLVATRTIPKGMRILAESPIFTVPRDNPNMEDVERIVDSKVESLNKDQQRMFYDLTNIYGDAHGRPLGISRTNVLPLGSNARSGGVFLEASRINHSCRHNAQNTWNESIKRLTVHALREIEEGQEITISYLGSASSYAERQAFLKKTFRFDCGCQLCSLPSAQRRRSDTRLRKIRDLDGQVGSFFWATDRLELKPALRTIHEILDLLKEEGIWDASIVRAYNDAYKTATESGDVTRARVFAERAYETRLIIEGDDSPITMKFKKRAKKISPEVPQGLREAGFENWLWMLD